jgi:hypothetical protein
VQHRFIQHGDDVRRLCAVQDGLALQPDRDQLVGLLLIDAGGEEQRAGVLGDLEQAGDDQRLPDA